MGDSGKLKELGPAIMIQAEIMRLLQKNHKYTAKFLSCHYFAAEPGASVAMRGHKDRRHKEAQLGTPSWSE
jgi:hypothetical protein